MEKAKLINQVKDNLFCILRDKERCKKFLDEIKTAVIPSQLASKLLRETNKEIEELSFYEDELNNDLKVYA